MFRSDSGWSKAYNRLKCNKFSKPSRQLKQPGMPGQEGAEQGQPGQEMPGQEQSDGSELDQHIGTLESMLQGSQDGSPEKAALQKSLDGIRSFQFGLRQKFELRKSEKAIAAISKAMNPKFTLGKTATKNLSEHGKKSLSMQEQIVQDLMKSMDDEESKAKQSIEKTLDFENLLKR